LQLADRLPISSTMRRTREGFLVSDVRAARVGIQQYLGSEVGRPQMDVVRVFRPEGEVFHHDAMSSFSSLTLTVDHPPEKGINSRNWKKYAVGFTGEDVARDGGFLRVPLILKDEAAITDVVSGKRELSFGYTCDIDFTPGRTEDGQEYDAVQRNLRGNHLAIVSTGRAGSDCRLGDTAETDEGGPSMADLKTILIDGIPVDVNDKAAAVIDTLQKRVDALNSDKMKMTVDHGTEMAAKDAAIAQKDKELGTKDAEIALLKAAEMTPAGIEKMIADRTAVLDQAKVVAPSADYAGKNLSEIRRTAVAARLGDSAVKDKSDDYVWALFDRMSDTADVVADSVRSAGGKFVDTSSGNAAVLSAHKAMVDRAVNAWKGN
jgi:hypothetical protein